MISHVGTFSEMEDQLCKFTHEGYDGEDSPDRAEAMIWAFTELFPDLMQGKSSVVEEDYSQYGTGEGAWMS
jgi:phage terminase large subunit-like protein